jgi:hypothetical protein
MPILGNGDGEAIDGFNIHTKMLYIQILGQKGLRYNMYHCYFEMQFGKEN